jgi:tetratricopeptide (TPR) repeat protein
MRASRQEPAAVEPQPASSLLNPIPGEEQLAPRLAGWLEGYLLVLGPASLGLLRALAGSADRLLIVGSELPSIQLQRRALAEHHIHEVDGVVARSSALPFKAASLGGAVFGSRAGELGSGVRAELGRVIGTHAILAMTPAGSRHQAGDPGQDGGPPPAELLASASGIDLTLLSGRIPDIADATPVSLHPTPRPGRGSGYRAAPEITVIIPTRNRAQLLSRALASVFAQQAAPAEILVVDDGSTDDTEAVLRSYGSRVRVLRRSPGGQGAAMNAGIAAAQSDWIAWLDDDDFFLPAKLRLQLRSLGDPEVGLAVTAHYVGDSHGRPYEARPVPVFRDHELLRLLLRGSIFLGPTAAVRRDAYAALGDRPYDETLPRAADYAVWWQLARRWRVAVLQVPLTVVCRHPGNELDLERARAIFTSVRRTLRWAWENVRLEELAPGQTDLTQVRLERAQALLRAGLWAEAVADLEAARDAEPERAGTLLGLAALESGDSAAAERHFSSVLQRAPANRDALNGLATVLILAGQRPAAERVLARAQAAHPRDPLTRYNAALAGEPSPTAPGPALRLARDLLAERGAAGAHFSPAPPLRGVDAFFVTLRRAAVPAPHPD